MATMQDQSQIPTIEKISEAFSERLRHLACEETVRAIVMLRTGETGQGAGRRLSRMERQALVERIVKSAEQSLPEVDAILRRFQGVRLVDTPDALGCIPVETTAKGIYALAASRSVRAILEDQALFSIS